METAKPIEMPQRIKDMVGKEHKMSGGLFSARRSEPEATYTVLDYRWGTGRIMNIKELQEKGESSYEYPVVEFLVKNESMVRARWTRGFPVKEINLKEIEESA